MSKEVTMFNFEGSDVRVIADAKGEPWFLAKDVCVILGIANYRDALTRLDDDEKDDVGITDTIGRVQQNSIINESGMYSLTMTSRKPEAKKFKKWVTSEVLPSIRKTGSYSTKPVDPMDLLGDPKALLQLTVQYAKKQIELENTITEKEAVILEQAPKVQALEKLTYADGSLNITEAAKTLNVPPRKMFTALEMAKWIYRRVGGSSWLGYQDKIQRGYVTHKVTTVKMNDGSEKISEQVRITPKGLTKLATMEF